jgi:4-amino-4-deoxy-L-arabinose transferase-like glycosyltransferase
VWHFIQRHHLAIVLAAYVVLAVLYGLIVPVGEGVDEVPHFHYVRHIKEGNGLPRQSFEPGQSAVLMGHHPPLYYLLGGGLIAWTDTSDANQVLIYNPHFEWRENFGGNGWNVFLHFGQDDFPYQGSILAIHYLRLWSTVMGAVAIWAIYLIGRRITERAHLAFAAACVAAFNPSFLFMTSTIHHDGLMAVIGALSLLWMVEALYRRPGWRGYAVGGVLLAAGLLTKLSGLSLIIPFGLTIGWLSWQQRSWRRLIRSGILVVGIAAGLSGWWYIRNQILYGDPLGWELFLSTQRHMVRGAPYDWQAFVDFVAQLQRTFWGAFGYMHITLPAPIYNTLWTIAGIACVGLVVALVRRGRSISLRDARAMAWIVLLTALSVWFASFVRFSIATVGAGHGRYLFPVSAALSLLMVTGLGELVPNRLRPAPGCLLAGGLFVYAAISPFVFIQPLYTSPPVATAGDLQGARRVDLDFGDALRLIAYRIDADSAAAGTDIHMDLYWQALGAQRPDLSVEVVILDPAGGMIGRSRRWPADNGTSIQIWSADTIYADSRTLRVADAAPPGPAQIILTVREGSRSGPPVLASHAGKPLGEQITLLSIAVTGAGAAP